MTATRITRPLVRLLLLAFAGLIATLGLGANTAHAANGACAGFNGCITSITSTPHFEDAELGLKTSVPTTAKLQYWDWNDRTSVPKVLAHRARSYSHDFTAPDLEQDVLYAAKVTVTAADGSQQSVTRFWQTHRRTVKVILDKVVVHKDGDPIGAGELRGGVRLFGEMDANVLFNVRRVNDGETLLLNEHTTFDRMPAYGLAALTMYEEDTKSSGQECNLNILFPVTNGSDECGDWATAKKPITMATDTSASPTQLVMSQSAGNLSFTAYLKIAVTIK